jgi:hypothetical protein
MVEDFAKQCLKELRHRPSPGDLLKHPLIAHQQPQAEQPTGKIKKLPFHFKLQSKK